MCRSINSSLVVCFLIAVLCSCLSVANLYSEQIVVLQSYQPDNCDFATGILKRIETDDGSSVQYLLELKGTWRQMGYAHGYLLGPSISSYYHNYFVFQMRVNENGQRLDVHGAVDSTATPVDVSGMKGKGNSLIRS